MIILFFFRVDNIPLLAKKSKEIFSSISPRTLLGEKIALIDLVTSMNRDIFRIFRILLS